MTVVTGLGGKEVVNLDTLLEKVRHYIIENKSKEEYENKELALYTCVHKVAKGSTLQTD